jgi:hypothetical protein
MPSWLPGQDGMTNFKKGGPFVKIDDGYARLPGAGYEALHPELQGLYPEEYLDIHKLRILSDVAPYSQEYNTRPLRPVPTKNPRVRALGRCSAHDKHSAHEEHHSALAVPVSHARWLKLCGIALTQQ